MPGADELNEFELFGAEDFDAYLPEKWNSKMFTLGRRKVKGKLELIGTELTEVLEGAGLSLVMHLSDEFPSLRNKKSVDTQWLFFSRDEAARGELTDIIDRERTLAGTLADPTPRYRHVFLGVSLNQDHLEIGMRLHHDAWVDRKNILNLLKTEGGPTRFKEALHQLPEHYEVSLTGDDTYSPPSLTEDSLEALADSFDNQRKWFFIGARLPRDQVLVLGADVTETAREVFEYLVPVYRFCAWSPENDAISLDELVAERNEAIEASRKELDREKAEREEGRRIREEQGLKLREEIQEKILETQAWRQREYAARRAAAARNAEAAKQDDARAMAEAAAAKLGLGGSGDTKAKPDDEVKATEKRPRPARDEKKVERPQPRAATRRSEEKKQLQPEKVDPSRAAEVVVGDLVEVKKGFLRRRRGVVQEIDEKGTLRVNFGALSSRLSLVDIRGLGPLKKNPSNSGYTKRGDSKKQDHKRRGFRGKLSRPDGGSSEGKPK